MTKDTKRTVRFSDRLKIKIIPNTEDLSHRRRKKIWFTDDEISRQRKRAYRLAEEFDFYTEEELFDKFGVRSMEALEKRWNLVEQTCQYVEKLEEEGKLFRSSSTRLFDPRSSVKCVDVISTLYCQQTREAAAMARDRALRLEQQVQLRTQFQRGLGCRNLKQQGETCWYLF